MLTLVKTADGLAAPTTAPAPRLEHQRLHYLDGLRGWAALSVVVYHATWEPFKFYLPAVRTSWPGPFNDGKLAVYIFFVLSGMVLSHPFLTTGKIEIVRLTALRRYTRLTIPIIAACFLALLFMREGWLFNQEANAILQTKNWLGSFYQFTPSFTSWIKFSFYDVFFRYDAATSYDVFLWTMPVELAGSFMVLGILALSGASSNTRYFFYVMLGLICAREKSAMLSFVYGAILAEFAASSVYTRLLNHRWTGFVGLAAFAIAFGCSVGLRPIYSPRLCSFIAGLMVLGIVLNGRLRTLLRAPVSQFLGRISFPLYLIHSLVLCSPMAWLIIELTRQQVSRGVMVAIVAPFTIAVSLLAATAFYPVERWAIVFSRGLSRIITARDRVEPRIKIEA